MWLSKAGYGSVDLLMSYDCDIFFNIVDYEAFVKEYESEYMAMRLKQ